MAIENERMYEYKYQKKYEKIARKQEKKRIRTDKYIKGVSNDVSNDSNKMRNKLSDKEKQAMFAEYEKIITVLKELELRNKKGEKFNYKFKNLVYFKSLNGHNIYSNALSEQEQKDKASISAMMAYSQIEGGLSVSIDRVMQNIRPERKDEFLSACKNNPYLSRDLVGMSKVVQYIKQKDYTRAYASVVYFGLEDKLDFMETFFKVGFNSEFKNQIKIFKNSIANLSSFDEKIVRDEAGTNVFSQHDAMTTAMKSSITGKTTLNVLTSNVMNNFEDVKSVKENSEFNIINQKSNIQELLEKAVVNAQKFHEIKTQHGGNIKAVRDNIIKGKKLEHQQEIKMKHKMPKRNKKQEYNSIEKTNKGNYVAGGMTISHSASQEYDDITTARDNQKAKSEAVSNLQNEKEITEISKQIEILAEKIKNSKTQEEANGYLEQKKTLEDSLKYVVSGSGQNLTDDNLNRKINSKQQTKEELVAKLNQTQDESKQQDLLQEIDKIISELSELQEIQETQNVELTNDINQTKEELALIKTKIMKFNREFIQARDDESRQQINDQLKDLHKQEDELNEKLQELLANSINKGNGFEDLITEYSHDNKTLSKKLKELQDKVKELSATPKLREENKKIIAECEYKIQRLETQINLIKENQKEISMLGMCDQYDAMLKILISKDTIASEDLKKIKKCVRKVEDFNKITGENLTQNEFNDLENNCFDKQFAIVDRKLFNKKLMGNMTCLYTRMISTNGLIDENDTIQLTSIRDARVAQIDKAIADVQKDIDSMKKVIESGETSGWQSEIENNISNCEAVLEALNKMKHTIEEKFIEKTGIVVGKKAEKTSGEQIDLSGNKEPENLEDVEQNFNDSQVKNEQKDKSATQDKGLDEKVLAGLTKKVEGQFEHTESVVEENNKSSQNIESQSLRTGSDQLTEEFTEGLVDSCGKTNSSVKANIK